MTQITKAIFPIAGLGTRFLPATKASAKEMLPIVDKPLIQYAVEEAYAAGIRQMIFITGRTKRSVEDHFDTAYELENELALTERAELLDIARNIAPSDMKCIYVRQPRALGLGHAVLCAKELIGSDFFALLLADDLMVSHPPVMVQMVEQFTSLHTSILAVESVPHSLVGRYGIVDGHNSSSNLIRVSNIVEKPDPKYTPSTLAVAGRYILSPLIFNILSQISAGIGGEIQLTDAISKLLEYEQVVAYRFHGRRYDCGSKLGFLQASVDLAEQHSEIGEEFTAWLAERMRQKARGLPSASQLV